MKTQLFCTALIAASFATAAGAQQEGAEAHVDEEELKVLPEFKAVDADEDGAINATETESLAKMLEKDHNIVFQFETVDKNRDGVINDEEYVAYDAVLQERLGIA